MKNILYSFLTIMLFSINVFCQTRNGIWFCPSKAKDINGLYIGPIENTEYNNRNINGLTIIIVGSGLLFGAPSLRMDSDERTENDYLYFDDYNGVALSILGSYFSKVNGFTGSFFISGYEKVNGVSINGLINRIENLRGVAISGFINNSESVKGIQIGLWNRTKKLKGIQIGLWNKNEKRSFPFINWCFK